MYVPFVRGKAAEMRALIACKDLLQHQYVFPVIDPTRGTKEFWAKLRAMGKQEIPAAVIVNPEHDELGVDNADLHRVVGDELASAYHIYPTLHIRASVSRGEVEQFLEYYASRLVALVVESDSISHKTLDQIIGKRENVDLIALVTRHLPSTYRPQSNVAKVVIEDPFQRARENAAYPPEQFFSDLVDTYAPKGFDGFGDYQCVGSTPPVTGFTPKAVVIHFSYESNNGVRVKHFVSTDRSEQVAGQVARKTRQALEKLLEFIESHRPFCGVACRAFVEAANNGDVPQLLTLKSWSIQHHIELMNHLTGRGVHAQSA